jgi:hypothetical protein
MAMAVEELVLLAQDGKTVSLGVISVITTPSPTASKAKAEGFRLVVEQSYHLCAMRWI